MSEQEYLVLDELYFLQSFSTLLEQTGMHTEELKRILGDLISKGWVKCLKSVEGEEPVGEQEYTAHYNTLFYLASKAGLLAHNSR